MAAERSSERRVVTCMFIDVVGSTDLTVRLGPERMKRELDRAFGELRDIVQTHGGTIEKYIGDAIFVLFGAPIAHADDPERALRAAAACVAWAARQTAMAVRVGIETGEALVDLAGVDARQQMAVGAVVNVAARLQAHADPGTVLVGPACRDATARIAEFADERDVELKGIGRASVATLVRVAEQGDVPQLPFVGRAAELQRLRTALERARGGRATFALVSGPPGQGKTRLIEELVRSVRDELHVLLARCRPGTETGAATPLWQLAAADAGEATLPALARRIGALVAEAVVRDETLEVIGHSIGIATSERLLALGPVGRRTEFQDAWRRYLTAIAKERPLLVWVEDLHWADPLFVGILDKAASRNDAPLAIVGTARPEFAGSTALRPSEDLVAVELGPLSGDDALALARHANTEIARTVDRAEGNPLFIVELARTRHVSGELPMTVQAAIAARIDELAQEDRRLLQHAAVVGETFGMREAALMADREPADVAGALARLAHARYLSPVGDRYRFHHALVHEVAYARLPVAPRMRLHARYAQEGLDPDDVEALAHHWWRALEPPDAEWVWESADEVARMRAAALDALLAAAARHADRLSHDSALELLTRAQSIATGPAEIGRVYQGFGWTYVRQAQGDAAWEHRHKAIDAYRSEGGDPPAALYADMLAVPTMNAGYFKTPPSLENVQHLFEEGERAARAQGDDDAALRLAALRAVMASDAALAREAFHRARSFPDVTRLGEVLRPIAMAQYLAAAVRDAEPTYRLIDEVRERGGFVNVGEVLMWRALSRVIAGDLAGASALARDLDDVAERSTLHTKGHALGVWATVLVARGDWDAVREVAHEVKRIVTENPAATWCVIPGFAIAGAAKADLLDGRSFARDTVTLAAQIMPSLSSSRASILMLVRAMVGEDAFGPEERRAYSDPVWWYRNWVDPLALEPMIACVVQRRWNELGPYLARLDAVESPLAVAFTAAVREELAEADGGTVPVHSALRELGYGGYSELLRFRAAAVPA